MKGTYYYSIQKFIILTKSFNCTDAKAGEGSFAIVGYTDKNINEL